MRIVLDANILYSALLNTDSEIAKVILKSQKKLNFYSTDLLFEEVAEHSSKLLKSTGFTSYELKRSIEILAKRIRIVDVRLIPKKHLKLAMTLLQNVDLDDTEYVALTEHIKGKLWTGDKILTRGLRGKGWDKFISTKELKSMTSSKRNR